MMIFQKPVLLLASLFAISQSQHIPQLLRQHSHSRAVNNLIESNKEVWSDFLAKEDSFDAITVYELLAAPNILGLSTDCLQDILLLSSSLSLWKTNKTAALANDFTMKALLPLLDSSAKIEPGILKGRITFTGHFSECKEIDYAVEGRDRHFKGDYFRLYLDPLLRKSTVNGSCGVEIDSYEVVPVFLAFDVCLPAVCSSDELANALHGLKGKSANPVCFVSGVNDNHVPNNAGYYIALSIVCVVAGICLIAGVVDYFFASFVERTKHGSGLPWQLFMAFSFYRNGRSVFDLSHANKPGMINPIHCIRFFSMCWVVMGHVLIYYLTEATNIVDVVQIIYDLPTEIINNGYFSVDTFFFLSGLLVSFIWFKNYYRNPRETNSISAWIMFYVHRVLRLSPAYYMAIIFYTFTFLQWTTDMPIFMSPQFTQDFCKANWWVNLLYINNYVNYKEACYGVGWYVSAEMQMYLFSPLLLVPLAIKPILGLLIALVTILMSTGANIWTVYHYHFPAAATLTGPQDPKMNLADMTEYSIWIYCAPYIRCQIYIMGMVVGWGLQRYKKIRIHPIVNIAGWVIGLSLMLTVVLGLHDYTNGHYIDVFWRAMYSSLSRPAWGLGLSWIIISCFYGYGGPMNDFMSWYIWVPLGRLTYCGYLTHVPVIMYLMGLSRDAFTFTTFTEVFTTRVLPYIAVTFFVAFIWSLLFEISFGKVEMLLLGGFRAGGGREKKNEKEREDEGGEEEGSDPSTVYAVDEEKRPESINTTNGGSNASLRKKRENEESWS